MGRLIRLDRSGHTTLARWEAGGAEAEAAVAAFRRELDLGMIASVSHPDGTAEVVRELPLDAEQPDEFRLEVEQCAETRWLLAEMGESTPEQIVKLRRRMFRLGDELDQLHEI